MHHRRNKYDVQIRFARLKTDLGALDLKLDELPQLFRRYYGITVCRAAIYHWFARGSMPLERFWQLLSIVRLHTATRLDPWLYVEMYNPHANEHSRVA